MYTVYVPACPANKRRLNNGGLMLGQRRRRWTNSKPAVIQRTVNTGEGGLHTAPGAGLALTELRQPSKTRGCFKVGPASNKVAQH